MNEQIRLLAFLITAGANVNQVHNDGCRSNCGNAKVVMLLVSSGANVNLSNCQGATSIRVAHKNG